jgi:DNA polymerase-3 subunit delta'
MLFSKVVGQATAKESFFRMWHSNHIPHALLLLGKEGTGGLPLALAMAQYIFCQNKHEHESCGKCVNCHKVSKLEHADLHLSFPTIPPNANAKAMSRHYIQKFREFVHYHLYGSTYDWLQYIEAENKQGNITAEECREIIDTLNLKSYEGGKKVHIIWRPEYLGKEGNILLKLIEEPPADTIILMVAENTEDILPTILSRTQTLKLSPIAPKDIAEALIHKSNTDPKHAAQVAHMADGSYTEALRMLKHSENNLFEAVRNWFNVLFTNNGPGISKFAEEWSKAGREQQKNLLQYVIQLLEQALRTSYLPHLDPALPEEEAQFVKKLAARNLPLSLMNTLVHELTQTIYYIERNAHSRTQLHALSIKMVYALKNRELPVL